MVAKTSSVQSAKSAAYDLRRADGSELHGLSPANIRDMAQANEIFSDDMLRRIGDDRWRAASALSGLTICQRPRPVLVVEREVEVDARVHAQAQVQAQVQAQPVESNAPIEIEQANRRAEQLESACDRLLQERDELLSQADRAREEIQRLSAQVARANADHGALKVESDAVRVRHDELEEQVAHGAMLERAIDDLRRQTAEAESGAREEIQRLSADLARTNADHGALKVESDAVRVRHDELEEQVAQVAMLERAIDDLRRQNAAAETGARETNAAHDEAIDQLERRLREQEQLKRQHDPRLAVALDSANNERLIAQQQAQEAMADRDELLVSLGHSQDSLRVSDDLRRALEKSALALKSTASEHSSELHQARQAAEQSRRACAAMATRLEAAETAVSELRHVKSEAATSISRAFEQRDAAIKLRETAIADRDAAISERDSTRLAVGATQTDLVRVRREFDAMRMQYESACSAIAEQTARAAALETTVAGIRTQNQEVTADRDQRAEDAAHLTDEVRGLTERLHDQTRRGEEMHQQICALDQDVNNVVQDRDAARTETAALHGELASVRESIDQHSQRNSKLDRELAQERSRVVARDELIFRESLRCEERETDNRRLLADFAALRADFETANRRAEDATAQVAAVQRDLQSEKNLVASQNTAMLDAQNEVVKLAGLEESARASLIAASRERDELAGVLSTAHAAIASREQQVSAERGLREQAEGSSRQLLASYEKLADDTGRRITDLEVKLAAASHEMQASRMREENLTASLADTHTQAKDIAQKLASVEEQRTLMTRDRDSHAKRASVEASARAAAEDKIAAAHERAKNAERDARAMHERSMQAAMIALSGSRQRLDDDFAQSRSEIDVLEQLIAEASKKVIETGGTLPGVPLMPREAAAKAAADAATAADARVILARSAAQQSASPVTATPAATAAPAAHVARVEVPVRPAPPTHFRLIDEGADDDALSRPQSARAVNSTGATGRTGGQRERVSQPRSTDAASSDDDSSSRSEQSQPIPPPPQSAKAPHRQSIARSSSANAAIDDAWIDDHCASDAAEQPPRAIGLIALTALGIALTATISAIPDFLALDLRAAFTRIAAWVIVAPALAALVQWIAVRCEPALARRIPILAAVTLLLAPLSNLALTSSPIIGGLLLASFAAIPWLMVYAAWPDARLIQGSRANDLIVGFFDRRSTISAVICALFAAAAIATTLAPWTSHSSPALMSPMGGLFALALLSLIALVLTPTLRARAPLAGWSAVAIVIASIAGVLVWQGAGAGFAASDIAASASASANASANANASAIPTFLITPALWIALVAAWSSLACGTLAAAYSPKCIADAIDNTLNDDSPVLVAHERINAACVMLLSALVPILPALAAFHLVRGRSRRAESQLRSLANFELWFAVVIALAVLSTLIAPAPLASAIFVAVLLVHAVICIGGAITMACDRFVRFPAPFALLVRPGGGLDLPLPIVTVQRTAEQSAHRPIVHPCGTTIWACVNMAMGCLAVASITRNPALTIGLGPILGLAVWLPSLIASRCRHQDTIVICALASAMIVLVTGAGFVLGGAVNIDDVPILISIAGAAVGVWALLIGWAFKGMSDLSSLARSSISAQVDVFGESLAPTEHPLAARRRDALMRRVVMGSSGAAAFAALAAVLPRTMRVIASDSSVPGELVMPSMPLIVCGSIALALTVIVWLSASLGDRRKLVPSAGIFTALLVIASFFAALPLFFRATEVGALLALRALPFCAVAAIAALLTAGIINTMREPRHLRGERKIRSQTNRRSSNARNSSTLSTRKKTTA